MNYRCKFYLKNDIQHFSPKDLPNYAQHSIPIYSLPQEWLWCETWCDDHSKARAKTIDLCNNPLHKQPKLDMAKRIISGSLFSESWTDLDNELFNLEQGIESSTQDSMLDHHDEL